jgi:hypothetical protein
MTNEVIHPLRRWLFEHQETLRTFGVRANVQPHILSRIMTGKRRPALVTMDKITRATGGEITANDFQRITSD